MMDRELPTSLCVLVLCLVATPQGGAQRQLPARFLIRGFVHLPDGSTSAAPTAILFNRHDAQNHYALVLGTAGLKLVRVTKGKEAVLAKPVGLPPSKGQTLQVLVKRTPRRIDCFVGPQAHLTTTDRTFTGGSVGTTKGAFRLAKFRVQKVDTIAFADSFMRTEEGDDPWAHLTGKWELDESPNPTWSTNAFRYIGRGKGVSLAGAGHWFWHDYAAKAALRPGAKCGAAGIACYVEDAGNYLVFRWQTTGAVELVRVQQGIETVLERKRIALDPLQWYEFGVAVKGDRVAAFLDGRCMVAAKQEGLRCGKVGLYCRDAAGVRFDDVAAESVSLSEQAFVKADAKLSPEVLPERRISLTGRFRSDRFMQQWASELGNWVLDPQLPGTPTFWHIGFYPNDFTLTWNSDGPLPFHQGPLQISVAPEDRDVQKGYTLNLSRDARTGTLDAHLTRLGEPVASWQAKIPAGEPISALTLERRGSDLCLATSDREIGRYTDKQPVPAARLCVRCRWSHPRTLRYFSATTVKEQVAQLPAVQDFEVTCPQLRDYTFHQAPVDWFAETGTWEITARWICLPHFTWLGGRSHEAAILWHKGQFTGDVIVDLYAAVMMDYGPLSGYDRYGDLNITICADGHDLSSGYSVMYGAYANTCSRIVRRDKVVAETRDFLYPPRSEGAHQNWYHLRIEKCGPRVRFFIGNQLAAEYVDPKPLIGKRIAIWTWNRGMLVARARIWAEGDGGPAALASHPKPASTAQRRQPSIRVLSQSHPSHQNAFDHDTEGWHCPTDEHGGTPRWVKRGDGGCLCVENRETGGDFAIAPPLPAFDAMQLQRLSFDYRLDPDVRINLYLRAFDKWHVVGLTAPTGPAFHAVSESRTISGRITATAGLQLEQPPPTMLGSIPAEPDGKWHQTAFDLLGALQGLYPGETQFAIEDLHFANWSNDGYLQCGFGGNRRGSAYWIDNLFLGKHGQGSGEITWQLADVNKCAWKIDQSPRTVPNVEHTKPVSKVSLIGLKSGTWFLHVATAPKGSELSVVHHRILVDVDPPQVAEVSPKPGSRAAPQTVAVKIADPAGAGIDPASVCLTVSGKTVRARSITRTEAPSEMEARFDLGGLTFEHEQAVVCEVAASDRAGNTPPKPFRWQWTFDRGIDKEPPSEPEIVRPAESPWNEDFEAPSDEWQRFPGSAWAELTLDSSTSSSGSQCLRVEGGPGPYRCYIRRKPFDFRAYPLLTFHYLATESTHWDIALETDKGWWAVAVNGGTRQYPRVGTMQPIADGRWHRAELPIAAWLASANAYAAPIVRAVAVVATNCRAGQTSVLRLDDLRLVPAVFACPELKLTWQAQDVSGIEGYSFVFDRRPDTVPKPSIKTTKGEAAFANSAGAFGRVGASVSWGTYYFHCRALDRAGHWGPPLHRALSVSRATDAQPPTVLSMSPGPDEHAAADTIRVQLEERGTGVSTESLKLAVAGQTYAIGNPELRLLPKQNVVEWRADRRNGLATPAFQNGTRVECSLEAADYAGNALPRPADWAWTMDFSKDKTPPPAPYVTWRPANAIVCHDFERDAGHCMGRREGWATLTDLFAATGRQCVRFGGFSTFLYYSQFDAARFPSIGFDYRLEPGAQLNLMVRIENRNWEIRFSSNGSKYPLIGSIDGIVADGTWHSCQFDLAKMLHSAPEPPRASIVDHLATLNRSQYASYIDNLFIAPSTGADIRVQWSVPMDATGILGYSFARDRSPATIPEAKMDGSNTEKTYTGVKPGRWHFHIRACDGAGNWGPTTHTPIEIGG